MAAVGVASVGVSALESVGGVATPLGGVTAAWGGVAIVPDVESRASG